MASVDLPPSMENDFRSISGQVLLIGVFIVFSVQGLHRFITGSNPRILMKNQDVLAQIRSIPGALPSFPTPAASTGRPPPIESAISGDDEEKLVNHTAVKRAHIIDSIQELGGDGEGRGGVLILHHDVFVMLPNVLFLDVIESMGVHSFRSQRRSLRTAVGVPIDEQVTLSETPEYHLIDDLGAILALIVPALICLLHYCVAVARFCNRNQFGSSKVTGFLGFVIELLLSCFNNESNGTVSKSLQGFTSFPTAHPRNVKKLRRTTFLGIIIGICMVVLIVFCFLVLIYLVRKQQVNVLSGKLDKGEMSLDKAILFSMGNTLVYDDLDEAKALSWSGELFTAVTVDGTLLTKSTMPGGTSDGVEARSHKWDDKKIEGLKKQKEGYELELEKLGSVREMEPERVLERLNNLLWLLEQFLACRPTGAAENNRSLKMEYADPSAFPQSSGKSKFEGTERDEMKLMIANSIAVLSLNILVGGGLQNLMEVLSQKEYQGLFESGFRCVANAVFSIFDMDDFVQIHGQARLSEEYTKFTSGLKSVSNQTVECNTFSILKEHDLFYALKCLQGPKEESGFKEEELWVYVEHLLIKEVSADHMAVADTVIKRCRSLKRDDRMRLSLEIMLKKRYIVYDIVVLRALCGIFTSESHYTHAVRSSDGKSHYGSEAARILSQYYIGIVDILYALRESKSSRFLVVVNHFLEKVSEASGQASSGSISRVREVEESRETEGLTGEGTSLVQQAEDAASNKVANVVGSQEQVFVREVLCNKMFQEAQVRSYWLHSVIISSRRVEEKAIASGGISPSSTAPGSRNSTSVEIAKVSRFSDGVLMFLILGDLFVIFLIGVATLCIYRSKQKRLQRVWPGVHCITLEKLYAEVQKLYKDVKDEEFTRFELEKKSLPLQKQRKEDHESKMVNDYVGVCCSFSYEENPIRNDEAITLEGRLTTCAPKRQLLQ